MSNYPLQAMNKNDFHIKLDQSRLDIILNMPKFDAQAAESFNKELNSVWNDKIDSAVVDLRAVQFIDSSGIGALLALRKRMPEESPEVTLLGPQISITSVLEMLRLHRVFRLEEI